MEESLRSGKGGRDNQNRGRGGYRGRGTGRGGRGGGFSGSLTNLNKVPSKKSEASTNGALNKATTFDDLSLKSASEETESQTASIGTSQTKVPHKPSEEEKEEAELCFICADPIRLYSIPPCNHRTCHVCAIRLRALYKKKECTFCKASNEEVIFSANGNKDFLSFSADDISFKDDKLDIYFENATSREDSLILLRFNCPDSQCDYVASSWADLRAHAKAEHERFFCDLCIKHSRIFAHEHHLYTSLELNRHVKSEHKYCDFCNLNFYSSDELYIHMRDRHEQCFICKRSEDRSDEYQRDYKMLERHFKSDHYLCESKECLEKKFVVFDSEMDFKAHQVAEHGTELSSREKREALRVTANFHFDASSSAARASSGQAGSSGLTARGKPRREEEVPETRRDVLGVSQLASRSHVPGAGGAADHQSRRAQFGGTLTTASGEGSKGKGKNSVQAALATAQENKEKDRVAQLHQNYMDQVYEILIRSDSKMASFRANVKVYRAGETSGKDLVDSIYSLVGEIGQVEVVVLGLIELIEERDKKENLLKAINMLRIERTQFPSLVPTSLSASGASNAAKGQIRNAKANSSSNSSNRIWENVERAASGGGGYSGMAAKASTTRDHFPTLGVNKKTQSGATIPGSANHSAMVNSTMRGATTAWAGSSSSSNNKAVNSAPILSSNSGRSTPVTVQPYSVEVTRDPERKNKTSIKSHPNAFPSLPSNSSAASLAAYKRSLFEGRAAVGNGSSGESTPKRTIWGSSLGRIDGVDDMDAAILHDKLGEAQINDRKKGKQKNVVMTLGSSRRGG